MDQELREYLQVEFAKVNQRIEEVRDELRGESRQTQVLVEHARDETRAVAEGVVANTERIEQLRKESHRERQEIRNELLGHIRSSYQNLDRRVTLLEERASDSPRRMPRL